MLLGWRTSQEKLIDPGFIVRNALGTPVDVGKTSGHLPMLKSPSGDTLDLPVPTHEAAFKYTTLNYA